LFANVTAEANPPHTNTLTPGLVSARWPIDVVFGSLTVAKYDPSPPTEAVVTNAPFTPMATSVPSGGTGVTFPPTVTLKSVVTSFPPEERVTANDGLVTSTVSLAES